MKSNSKLLVAAVINLGVSVADDQPIQQKDDTQIRLRYYPNGEPIMGLSDLTSAVMSARRPFIAKLNSTRNRELAERSLRRHINPVYDLAGIQSRALQAAQQDPKWITAVENCTNPHLSANERSKRTFSAALSLLDSDSPDLHCFALIQHANYPYDEVWYSRLEPRHIEGIALAAEQSRRVCDGEATPLLGENSAFFLVVAKECLVTLSRLKGRTPAPHPSGSKAYVFEQTFGTRIKAELEEFRAFSWSPVELKGVDRALRIMGPHPQPQAK